MLSRALAVVIAVVALAGCASNTLTKHQLRECCMAGAFETCRGGCIKPSGEELEGCRAYQRCRTKCSGRNEFEGQPLDGHPSTCAKLCAKRAVQNRPTFAPRCPDNKPEGDLPEAIEQLDLGEEDAGADLPPDTQKADLPDHKEGEVDLPSEHKPDLPPDPDR